MADQPSGADEGAGSVSSSASVDAVGVRVFRKRTFWGAGLVIGWLGGLCVGAVESALMIARVGRHFGSGDLPPLLLPGEAARIIVSHAILWTALGVVLTALYGFWRGVVRRRAGTGHPEAFLAAMFVFVAALTVPPTWLLVLGRYRPWLGASCTVLALFGGVVAYVVLRWAEGWAWFGAVRRAAAVCAGIGVPVFAGALVVLYRSPAVGPAGYAVPSVAQAVPRAPGARTGERPNVLWIVWDTVRADRTSLYDEREQTTPYLRRLAAESLVFENAIANGVWTMPAHASMFTGLSVSGHGTNHGHTKLHEAHVTIAELLRARGYATLLFSNNPQLGAWSQFTQGFEHAPPIGHLQLLEYMSPSVWWQYLGTRPPASWFDVDMGAARTGGIVAHWLDRRLARDRPWFIFVNYLDAHLPTLVPRRQREMFLDAGEVRRSYALRQRVYGPIGSMYAFLYNMFGEDAVRAADGEILGKQYRASLRHLDERLEELLAAFEERGLLENTYVIVTSDHGEAHGEHRVWGHDFCVYDTLARVPLLVRHPGGQRVGRNRTLVQLSDLYATVAGWAGVAAAELPPGVSPALPDEAGAFDAGRVAVTEYLVPMPSALARAVQRDPAFDPSRFLREHRALYQGIYKFIRDSEGERELYDLSRDPREQVNLYGSMPAVARRYEELLARWQRETRKFRPPEEGATADMPADVAERLRSLGYVQ